MCPQVERRLRWQTARNGGGAIGDKRKAGDCLHVVLLRHALPLQRRSVRRFCSETNSPGRRLGGPVIHHPPWYASGRRAIWSPDSIVLQSLPDRENQFSSLPGRDHDLS